MGINRSDVTAGITLDSGAAIVSNTLRIRDDAAPEGGELVIEGPSDINRFHLDVTESGDFGFGHLIQQVTLYLLTIQRILSVLMGRAVELDVAELEPAFLLEIMVL